MKEVLQEAAKAGRGWDDQLGHLSKRDIVVPFEIRDKDLDKKLRDLFANKGRKMARFTVGDKRSGRFNPTTGLQEFESVGGEGGGDASGGGGGSGGGSGGGGGGGSGGGASETAAEHAAGQSGDYGGQGASTGVGEAAPSAPTGSSTPTIEVGYAPGVTAGTAGTPPGVDPSLASPGGPTGSGTAANNPEIARGGGIPNQDSNPNAGLNAALDAYSNRDFISRAADFVAGLVPGVTPGALQFDAKTGQFGTGLAFDAGKFGAGLADFGIGLVPGGNLLELASKGLTGTGLAGNALELARSGSLGQGGLTGVIDRSTNVGSPSIGVGGGFGVGGSPAPGGFDIPQGLGGPDYFQQIVADAASRLT